MADIKTYEEMDRQIKGILRMQTENSACLYAAQRIEELEQNEESYKKLIQETTESVREIRLKLEEY